MHRAAVTVEPGRIEMTEVELERRGPDEAVVEIDAVGICGTDLHIFGGEYTLPFPVIQGHEVAGRVADLPAGYRGDLEVGTRVAVEPSTRCGTCFACRNGSAACASFVSLGVQRPGGLQQLMSVPVAQCHATDGFAPEVAVLCEPASVALRCVTRAGVRAGENVVVLGCGPIGLGVVLACADLGANVMAVDVHPARLALAARVGATETALGVDAAHEQVAAWTHGDGAAVVVEATGAPVVAEAAVDLVGVGGRISMVGVSEKTMALSIRAVTRKEVTLVGSLSTLQFAEAVALVERRRHDFADVVTHEFAFEQAEEALRFTLEQPDQTIKTIIRVGA